MDDSLFVIEKQRVYIVVINGGRKREIIIVHVVRFNHQNTSSNGLNGTLIKRKKRKKRIRINKKTCAK